MNNIEVRLEDEVNVYIAKFDRVYTDVIVDLCVIHKRSAQTVQPMPQHYYKLGFLMGMHEVYNTQKVE